MSYQANARSKIYNPVTCSEVLFRSIGMDLNDVSTFCPANEQAEDWFRHGIQQLPLIKQPQVRLAIGMWTAFCSDMASWYSHEFSRDPVILISMPSSEMCEHFRLPRIRGFLTITLGRIVENIDPLCPVEIVDCQHDPLTHPELAAQASYWVRRFPRLQHDINQLLNKADLARANKTSNPQAYDTWTRECRSDNGHWDPR